MADILTLLKKAERDAMSEASDRRRLVGQTEFVPSSWELVGNVAQSIAGSIPSIERERRVNFTDQANNLTQMAGNIVDEKGFSAYSDRITGLLNKVKNDPKMMDVAMGLENTLRTKQQEIGSFNNAMKDLNEFAETSIYQMDNVQDEFIPFLDQLKGMKNEKGEDKYDSAVMALLDQKMKAEDMKIAILEGRGKGLKYGKGGQTDNQLMVDLNRHIGRLNVAMEAVVGDGIITPEELEYIARADIEAYEGFKNEKVKNIQGQIKGYSDLKEYYEKQADAIVKGLAKNATTDDFNFMQNAKTDLVAQGHITKGQNETLSSVELVQELRNKFNAADNEIKLLNTSYRYFTGDNKNLSSEDIKQQYATLGIPYPEEEEEDPGSNKKESLVDTNKTNIAIDTSKLLDPEETVTTYETQGATPAAPIRTTTVTRKPLSEEQLSELTNQKSAGKTPTLSASGVTTTAKGNSLAQEGINKLKTEIAKGENPYRRDQAVQDFYQKLKKENLLPFSNKDSNKRMTLKEWRNLFIDTIKGK